MAQRAHEDFQPARLDLLRTVMNTIITDMRLSVRAAGFIAGIPFSTVSDTLRSDRKECVPGRVDPRPTYRALAIGLGIKPEEIDMLFAGTVPGGVEATEFGVMVATREAAAIGRRVVQFFHDNDVDMSKLPLAVIADNVEQLGSEREREAARTILQTILATALDRH